VITTDIQNSSKKADPMWEMGQITNSHMGRSDFMINL